VRSLYFKNFSASFWITFLSPGTATSINIHVPFSLSRITMSGLLGMVLSVCTCWFHSMVTLPPRLVYTDFGTCSYQCFLSSCTPVSLNMLKGTGVQLDYYYYYYYYYYYLVHTLQFEQNSTTKMYETFCWISCFIDDFIFMF
jgi:hypothetical protein